MAAGSKSRSGHETTLTSRVAAATTSSQTSIESSAPGAATSSGLRSLIFPNSRFRNCSAAFRIIESLRVARSLANTQDEQHLTQRAQTQLLWRPDHRGTSSASPCRPRSRAVSQRRRARRFRRRGGAPGPPSLPTLVPMQLARYPGWPAEPRPHRSRSRAPAPAPSRSRTSAHCRDICLPCQTS